MDGSNVRKRGRVTVGVLVALAAVPVIGGSVAALRRPTTTTTTTTAVTTTGTVPSDMLNPDVTQATTGATICRRGWTTTVRPPASYTEPIKRLQVHSYGYADQRLSSYEEDHAVALELGGNGSARVNLWPEPHKVSVPDDGLESSLHSSVCAGRLTLSAAQSRIFAAKVAHGYDRARSTA